MSFLKGAVKGLGKFVLGGGLLGLGVNALFGGKKKKPPVALPQATRDDAEALAARDDALRLRRGSAADQLLGGGAEPGAGTLGRFVLGS